MVDYKEETLKVYDQFPDYFNEKFDEYLNKYIKNELDSIMLNFPANVKILDVGSGPGNHAAYLNQRGFDVLCLDISEKFLEMCKERGLKTIRMDFENLTFPEESFDVVWAYTSLLHIPKTNLPAVLNRIDKILNKDGFFVISMKEGNGEGFVEFEDGKRWFSLYQQTEIESLLKDRFSIAGKWKVSTTRGKVFLDYLCKKLS